MAQNKTGFSNIKIRFYPVVKDMLVLDRVTF